MIQFGIDTCRRCLDPLTAENMYATNIRKGSRICKRCQKGTVQKAAKSYRSMAFDHYGRLCLCCSESIDEFLTIDHIEGKGNKHREMLRAEGYSHGDGFYRWLYDHSWPEGYRTLCMNCNWSFGVRGSCPHGKLPARLS